MKHIVLTVINDLTYDQRMLKICSSLANAGYRITLIGRKLRTSKDLRAFNFESIRLKCWFSTGKLMYFEFNFRLLIFLLFNKQDVICAIDLDTILPCFLVSKLKGIPRVYDAHELFTEQKEIVTRPNIQKLWLRVEKWTVPHFKVGYTVNEFIVNELNKRYGVRYKIVRNLPVYKPLKVNAYETSNVIIYQGAVNEGRSFETLIPAMCSVNTTLMIYGNGNFFKEAQKLILNNNLADKVFLKGSVVPELLAEITPTARIAVTLFENTGLNQYHSLANRFFDYIMAGVPQVCVGYPEYKAINDKYEVAYLIDNTEVETIANALNNLLSDDVLYNRLRNNCLVARELLNWSTEEKVLLSVYNQL